MALAKKMNSPARARITRSTGLAAMYRPPARTASPTCSRGSASGARAADRQAAITPITTMKLAALTRNTVPALAAASRAPPMAGPS